MSRYRRLLHIAPRRLRERHGHEMEALLLDRLNEARRRGRLAVIAVWMRAAVDIAASIPREMVYRWRQRGRVGVRPERRAFMFSSDIRYAWRSLNHQRFASVLVVVMLALGIGATVAVFSLVNGLFLRPLPFPEADRLVYINETAPKWNLEMTGINYHDFAQWHRDQKVFDAIALWDTRSFNVATESGADRMNGAGVTADFLKVLRIEPLLGRMFTPEEDRPNGPLVTLIGEALWHERFGGRADVLGRELKLNSRSHTIIGVLPKAAEFPAGARLWVPVQGNPNADEQNYNKDGIGRLKPGVTIAQANADLVRTQQVIFDTRDKERVVTPFARDLRTQFTRDYSMIASTLSVAVALLLIVACANVAALMLARALARRREVGIRLAVGASRARLLRQLLVENVILSVIGGAAGLALGQWAMQLLVSALPDQAPQWATFALDWRMVAFTLATSMATAVLFGWAPALHALNADVRGAMSTATAGSTAPVRGRRTLHALLVAEFALASMMFVCGGLLVRAYDRVRNTDPGFNPTNVLTFTASVPTTKYTDEPAQRAFFARLKERLIALPGVTNVGSTSCAPVSGCHWGVFYTVEGAPPRAADEPRPVVLNVVASHDYFAAIGMRLKEGRFFDERDGTEERTAEGTIIVNETFAKNFWPNGESPLGKRVRPGSRFPWQRIVGVVHDVKHYGLERDMRPNAFVPNPRMQRSSLTFVVRASSDPAALGPEVRQILRELDPEVPAYDLRSMEERLQRSNALRAAYSWMLAVFAGMALLLALGGSYGVTSYLVSQRSRELGIRVALGARSGDIATAVMKGSLAVVLAGVVIGVGGALGAGRLLSSLLFGVPPYDAVILITAAVALFGTACLANWLPARRAARIDPMVSLRSE